MNAYNGNNNGDNKFDWTKIAGQYEFNQVLLAYLGYSLTDLPGLTHNPVTERLATDENFVTDMEVMFEKAFNRTSLSKLATLCQMCVFDNIGGPERDNKPKALRRHWYAWYKTKFAQPAAFQWGDYTEVNNVVVYSDIAWSQRLSQTYAWFVDNAAYQDDKCPGCERTTLTLDGTECYACEWTGHVLDITCTYKDLWVEDASRMMARAQGELFKNSHIVVAVEKDSLFSDFEQAAKALGATCIISGKGKSSKAAIEKMLRDHFRWTSQPIKDWNWQTQTMRTRPPIFSRERPMHIIHVSDHDYDGEAVIGPTFAEQVRRYTPHVKEARVGIKPEDLTVKGYDLGDQMYSVKLSNEGYKKWARRQALFLTECVDCGHTVLTKGTAEERSDWAQVWPYQCTECNGPLATITVEGANNNIAYGLEVEAMTVADYRDLMVWSLLTILDFDFIVLRLRAETLANDEYAAIEVRDAMLRNNPSYQELLAAFDELERKKRRFENAVKKSLWPITSHLANCYEWQGDDPGEQDYVAHVERADWGPWRPFSTETRTAMLVSDIQEGLEDFLNLWTREYVEDYDDEEFDSGYTD